MISISYGENSGYDGYGKTGLEHFIQTYGIAVSKKGSQVNLSYGRNEQDKNCHFNVIVNSNPEDNFEAMACCEPGILAAILNPGKHPDADHDVAICSLPFISVGKNSIDIASDVFSFTGRCLAGELEPFWKNIPKYEREKLGKIPLIDVYERVLFIALLHAFEERRLPLVCKSLWPGNKFAVCLTHDVDEVKKTYQWVTRPLMYLKNRRAGMLKGQLYSLWHKLYGEEPFWTFNKIIEFEKELNVKSSFYFLKEKSKVKVLSPDTWKLLGRRYDFNDHEIKEIMKKLHCGGWDVGLHGSYDSYCSFEMLEQEKNSLKVALGSEIKGIRQHHLHLDNPGTWEYHEKAGLEYDTTLGFKDQMGFKGGTCLPFHPISGKKRLSLLEIPLAIMDTPLFRHRTELLHAGFEEMVNVVAELNGVLTLLWHHAAFNEYEYPGWSKAYGEIIELCRKKNAWITSAKEISDWWIRRERTELDIEYEGNCLRITPHTKDVSHFLSIYLPTDRDLKKIHNAQVIEADGNIFTVRTDRIKNNESIEMELAEMDYGN